jgi:hypothetical protein
VDLESVRRRGSLMSSDKCISREGIEGMDCSWDCFVDSTLLRCKLDSRSFLVRRRWSSGIYQ